MRKNRTISICILRIALCILTVCAMASFNPQRAEAAYNVTVTGENLEIRLYSADGTIYSGGIHSTSPLYVQPDAINVKMCNRELSKGEYFYANNGSFGYFEIYNVDGDIEIIAEAGVAVYEVVKAETCKGWDIDRTDFTAGEDFTAIITLDENYEYNSDIDAIRVLINNSSVRDFIFDPLTGELFISGEKMIGKMIVYVETVAKNGTPVEVEFVSLKAKIDNTEAVAGEEFNAVITAVRGHKLESVNVNINGRHLEEEEYSFDLETGAICIPAEKVLGKITIDAIILEQTYSITFLGENVTAYGGESYTTSSTSRIISFRADSPYELPQQIEVKIDGRLGVQEQDYHYYTIGIDGYVDAYYVGNYEITVKGQQIYHRVLFSGTNVTFVGESVATQNADYTAKIVLDDGYGFGKVEITSLGNPINYYFNDLTGEIIIYGSEIKNTIEISVTPKQGYKVIYNAPNVTVKGINAAFFGYEYQATVKPEPNFYLADNGITISSDGKELISGVDYTYDKITGDLRIFSVSADTEITVKTLHNHIGSEHTSGVSLGEGLHAYICTVCGEENTEACHGGTAYCGELAKCQICGSEHGELAPYRHLIEADGGCKYCDYQNAAKIGDEYYESLEDALYYAPIDENCEVVLFLDCEVDLPFEIRSGKFTINLNGKTISSKVNCAVEIYGAEVTFKGGDGGSVTSSVASLEGSTVTIDGGNYEEIVCEEASVIVLAGEIGTMFFDCLVDDITLYGGSFDTIVTVNCNPELMLGEDYCYFNGQGKVIDCNSLTATSDGRIYLTSTTVKKHADSDHSGGEATCKTLAICEICDREYGKYGEHSAEDDGDCTTAINCSVCNEEMTPARESHTGGEATCKALAICEICGKEYGELAEHKSTDDGDCTTAQRCSLCNQITVNAKQNHEGGEATCNDLAICEHCGKAYGELSSHNDLNGDGTCDTCGTDIEDEKESVTSEADSLKAEGRGCASNIDGAIGRATVLCGVGALAFWLVRKRRTA